MTPIPVVVSLAALAHAVIASPCAKRPTQAVACTDVHLFVARGSMETIPGVQGKLADAVCAAVPSCSSEDIQYPASLQDYCSSVGTGVAAALAAINTYATACPDSKLVLTGYSQGAHLVGDTLSGGGGQVVSDFLVSVNCTQATSSPLDTAVGEKSRSDQQCRVATRLR